MVVPISAADILNVELFRDVGVVMSGNLGRIHELARMVHSLPAKMINDDSLRAQWLDLKPHSTGSLQFGDRY
jgi:hypothetical protein